MTTRGRLNARLEPELERKLAYLRDRTGLGTSDVVRASIERYYEALRAEGANARAALEASGFVGSGAGPADLSERHKQYLAESLTRKHS
ncbi:MAG: CopG family transcriptional regulator [Polyangiaceae bacterium]